MTHSAWVYIQSGEGLRTVGFYDPDGVWHADSDHGTDEKAAERVHYLNGGDIEIKRERDKLRQQIIDIIEEIPDKPKLPLVVKILEIARRP